MVVKAEALTVSSNDGLRAVFAVKSCLKIFFCFSTGCFRINLSSFF